MAAGPGGAGALSLRNALPALALASALALPGLAQAEAASARYCDGSAPLTAAQQDRLLRVADLLRSELLASDSAVALVARSGLDLARFGLRHSHAGIGLRDAPAGAWAVRQLFYACDEQRPRLFDQGLPGFVSGVHDPEVGFVSALLLPDGPAARALARSVLDTPRMQALLAGRYNAVAYPWATHSQNCNQWVVEALADAWASATGADTDAADTDATTTLPSARTRAQRWLNDAGYQPLRVQGLTHGLVFLAGFMPLLNLQEHPQDDRFALQLQVSVPASIDTFVRQRLPAARVLQLCFTAQQAVLRHGDAPLPSDCRAQPGDRVLPLH